MSVLVCVARNSNVGCINIYCPNPLTDFDIERQSSVRQNKFVFCAKCRRCWARGKVIFWKCLNCTHILTSTSDPLHKQYCNLKCRCNSYYGDKK